MKRLALGILAAAAAADLAGDPHSAVLFEQWTHASGALEALSMVFRSPIITKIEYWGLSLIGAIAISLALSLRRPAGPDILSR